MGCWMVLGKIIGKIFYAFSPMYVEHLLVGSASNPVKSHIHTFGSLLLYCIVDNAFGAFVVGLDWGGVLRVAHFDQRCAGGTGGSWPFMKQAANSDSAADDRTGLMMLLRT